MVPDPETAEPAPRSNVPPLNSRIAGVATAHVPPPEPPLPKLVVPVRRSTVPVLLNGTVRLVRPVPADLRKVPALLNTGDPPPLAPIGWLFCTSNVPLLLNVPPVVKMMLPPPPVQVA